MDKIYYITMLYDFYGELLTDKQRSVMESYYLQDFSLHEVAEEHDITRQAVQDMLKRTEKLLKQYEEKLGLFAKFLDRKERAERLIAEAEKLDIAELKKRIASIAE